MFNSLLSVEASYKQEKIIVDFIEKYLGGYYSSASCGELGKASALVAYHWFGGDLSKLKSLMSISKWNVVSTQVARSYLSAIGSRYPKKFKGNAVQFVGHPSDDVARLVQFYLAVINGEIGKVSCSFANLKPKWPHPGRHYDPRAWVAFESLSQTGDKSPATVSWLKGHFDTFKKYSTSIQERRILSRINKRMHFVTSP